MDAVAEIEVKLAALPDRAYLDRNESTVNELPMEAALAGFQGLLLGAPRRVEWSRNGSFSALLLLGNTQVRDQQLPFHRNATVFAMDIDRGEVFEDEAFPLDPTKHHPPPEPEPPPDLIPTASPGPPEGTSAGTVWLDIPELLGLPRRDMRLALRVFYFDQVSNAVLVECTVDGRLPAFESGPATPKTDIEGVTFSLGPIGPTLPLHAKLRVALSPATLVRAVVLVLLRGHNRPHVFPVEVPVAGQAVDVSFSVDLAALLPPAAVQPGAQVYVLAGRHIAGPQPLAQ